MGRKGNGLEIREKSMRIAFVWNGESYKETLTVNGHPIAPTAAHIKHGHRIADEVKSKLRLGVFDAEDFASYFPDSKHAHKENPRSFGFLADRWLESKGQLTVSTVDQYGTAVRFWKRMFGESSPIESLTHAVITSKIGKYKWKSPKQFNNYMVALRGTMGIEYRGRKAVEDPTIGIENMRGIKRIPDPLTPAERESVLTYMRETFDIRIWAYFAFAFFTGMRPEEIIALRWSDWDRAAGRIRVRRVRTFRGSERDGSKTHAERDVDLVDAAHEALLAMVPFTLAKTVTREGEEDATCEIFERPAWAPGPADRGGRPSPAGPWMNEREQRDRYWKPALAACGIRQRRAYATRHTYCTAALMGGVNPAYIAAQAGHSVKMLLDTYARWVPEADDGSERRRMNAAQILPRNSPEHLAAESEKGRPSYEDQPSEFGRRNWTRTKD